MILSLMALCILVMRAFPETPMARWLNTVLIDRPVVWLSQIRRRDVIFLFVLIALLLVANDLIILFGVSDLIAIGANLSIYFDAVLVSAAVTIAATAATAWRGVRERVSTWWGAAVRRRTRAVRQDKTRKTRQPKSLDDEDAPGWAPAYAV
jgi:hypothetical protein